MGVKLIYRNKTKVEERISVTEKWQAYDALKAHWDMDEIELREECKALFLDHKCRVMSYSSISKGGFAATYVDLRYVFTIALKRRASSIILAHNHPSGNLRPSQSDLQLTRDFIEAGKILRLPVVDHLIITKDGFSSVLDFLPEQ